MPRQRLINSPPPFSPARFSRPFHSAFFRACVEPLQISYWSSSPTLSDTRIYPLFMRTMPVDVRTAEAICKYWQQEGYTDAAVRIVSLSRSALLLSATPSPSPTT
eukprot:4490623-Pleurochrysis_carterae.AAC.4